ncbi:uncharacterized protein LOC132544748 [Ylistrum balloti]|uniref:uncharacterized protein LOC132544748 n=1 Tax=Ylistrum balloti TaxID=509963 RepID=UPI002905E844|nr:uncharacterized protein LOC132544748 [Ylistrum balloti]
MNEVERNVLLKRHRDLVDTIDPYELRPFLYSKGVLPGPTYLDDIPIRTKRAEIFLGYIVDTCSFSLFLEALSEDDAFDFLAVKLREDLENITRQNDHESQNVYHELKEDLNSTKRGMVVSFRHKLKRYSMSGATEEFFQECQKITDRWKAIPKPAKFLSNNKDLADMYAMVLDAKMERRRILYDKTLHTDEELFDAMLGMSAYTSSANLPVAMYLVRYGSALLMAGKPVEEALSHVEQAKQRLQTLPACLESGVVLYIEYNMLISKKYENMPTDKMKNRLLKIGAQAIDHFGHEQETVGKDFRRILLIKQALLLLGIGLFLNNLDSVIVSKEDRERAEKLLQEIPTPNYWERMEPRWKVRYHAAKSKLFLLKDQMPESLSEINIASEYATAADSEKEVDNIKETVAFLSERQKLSFE